MPPSAELIRIGFLASLVAGLATGAGALPVLFTKQVSDRILDVMLGFAAGVMLAATAFSLLIPAIELGGIWTAVLGTIIGGLFLHLVAHMAITSTSTASFCPSMAIILAKDSVEHHHDDEASHQSKSGISFVALSMAFRNHFVTDDK